MFIFHHGNSMCDKMLSTFHCLNQCHSAIVVIDYLESVAELISHPAIIFPLFTCLIASCRLVELIPEDVHNQHMHSD